MNKLFLSITPAAERLEEIASISYFQEATGESSFHSGELLDYWPALRRQLLAADILVLFNAQNQLEFLDRVMVKNGLTITPLNYYSLQNKTAKLVQLDSYDFKTVCNYYKLSAADDKLQNLKALFELLADAEAFGGLDRGIKFFTLDKNCGHYTEFFRDLTELEKLVNSIRCDGQVQPEEFSRLSNWHNNHKGKSFAAGYAPVMTILDSVLVDGKLTIDECDDILNWLSTNTPQNKVTDKYSFIWPILLKNIAPEYLLNSENSTALLAWMSTNSWQGAQKSIFNEQLAELVNKQTLTQEEGVEVLDKFSAIVRGQEQQKEWPLKGKTCVLTGSFQKGSRHTMENLVREGGGILSAAVNRHTDYLIVGGENNLGLDSRIGRQIRRAKELIEQGAAISIIDEAKIWPQKQIDRWRGYGQNFIMALILLNLVASIIETTAWGKMWAAPLEIFNNLSALIFVIEMTVRIALDRRKFFIGRHCGWNYFDLAITVVTTISALPFTAFSSGSSVSTFRLLRLLRTIRSVRTLRVISHMKNLRLILGAMLRSLPKIGWTSAMMAVIFIIYGTVGTNLFGDLEGCAYFQNLGRSMFTMVQLMTFDDLGNIATPILQAYPAAILFFLSFIFIISFVMLNILTGIIVDSIADISANEQE